MCYSRFLSIFEFVIRVGPDTYDAICKIVSGFGVLKIPIAKTCDLHKAQSCEKQNRQSNLGKLFSPNRFQI